VNNYKDKYNVQYCDLVGLPDLLTSSSYVQNTIANYIKNLYSRGVKGIRIDAAKHQDAGELSGITKQLPSDMYIGQEVIGAAGEAVQPNMYYGLGQVSEFYYADYLDTNIINPNKMIYLQTFGESWGLMPDQYAAVFLDK
jgi:alpha-amylase